MAKRLPAVIDRFGRGGAVAPTIEYELAAIDGSVGASAEPGNQNASSHDERAEIDQSAPAPTVERSGSRHRRKVEA